MENRFSPSVNIIRDATREINYTITPNATRVAAQIEDLYKKGFHCFSIIGSYGSGKSSFLWAFEKSLAGNTIFFDNSFDSDEKADFINIVGQPASLQSELASKLNIPIGRRNAALILSKLERRLTTKNLTILVIDEFGKFLEYAVKNNTDEEIYFLQQLAELINTPEHNCMLISTLHQSFDAYGHYELSVGEKNEWRKVKGRFKDLTFNEPIEQLLLLAAKNIGTKEVNSNSMEIVELQMNFHIINSNSKIIDKVAEKLWPLDIISAYLLCVALQRYGQNERSLFTFLESEFGSIQDSMVGNRQIGVPEIYDYLYHEFYSYLNSKYNVDYSVWSMMDLAFGRIDSELESNKEIAEDIVKLIGLTLLFGHKGAHMEKAFITAYLGYQYEEREIENTINQLVEIKLLRFNRFSRSYKIMEGTDLDFEGEFLKVSEEIDNELDITAKLQEYFSFPVVNAKAISYRKGTPRFFEYTISEKPLDQKVEGQIDGLINLVFGPNEEETRGVSSNNNHTIYARFLKVVDVRQTIYEIEKTQRVMAQNKSDKVALKELETILKSQKNLLNHQVIDALFTENVIWYYLGKPISVGSKKELNKRLSNICETAYDKCPTFRNELINRHFISGNIANSKKTLFEAVVSNHHIEDLGFSKTLFPAEKTIYLTLLKKTGIHQKVEGAYTFKTPEDNEFLRLWTTCEAFLESAKTERKGVLELFELLSQKPYKLTQGFLDFWIPIFLYIKRDDFALYSREEGYLPELNATLLYLFTRTAKDYEIKTFNVEGVKLDLFNKYREFLALKDTDKVNNKKLIESIKPFLVFHKDLNPYARTTSRLSEEAIRFRETIESVQDPESLFFQHFPKALNTEVAELLKSEAAFENYIGKLRSSIRELRTCFDELVNRLELFLLDEVLMKKDLSFADYKEKLISRYAKLKEHMLIRSQASFLIRLRSPLDDRNSWLNSISQVTINKRLDALEDQEEEVLKEKLRKRFHELDNLVSISDLHEKRVDQDVLKLELTSFDKGLVNETILVPKEVHDDTEKKLNEIEKLLGSNKKINLYLLVNILKKQLDE